MQKWEYCAIGPIKDALGNWLGSSPRLYSFLPEGLRRDSIGKPIMLASKQADVLARIIAQLGDDGWEMVGCGSAGDEHGIVHYLYFKRAKQNDSFAARESQPQADISDACVGRDEQDKKA